jgi:DNA-binding NarL/FixJ family response regulator
MGGIVLTAAALLPKLRSGNQFCSKRTGTLTMGYAKTSIAKDDARAGTPGLGQDVDAQRPYARVGATADRSIALIEARPLRECIRRSMQSALSLPVVTYSTASELEGDTWARLVVLSLTDASQEACAGALRVLAKHVPGVPIIVLASTNDVDLARTAIRHGAKGYIPCTMGFEIALEAMRFVLVGGSYAPVDCLLATPARGPASETLRGQPSPPASEIPEPLGDLTSRERKGRSGDPTRQIEQDHRLRIEHV